MSCIYAALTKAEERRRASGRSPAADPELAKMCSEGTPAVDSDDRSRETADGSVFRSSHARASANGLLSKCVFHPWLSESADESFVDMSASEEFSTLRSRLHEERDARSIRSVLITSGLRGEGKSYVAANLARALVRRKDVRVLLVDGNLRNSQLHNWLGSSQSPGLSDYLAGDSDEISVMQRGTIENLFFIPGGSPASHSPDLLANGRLDNLLIQVGAHFDWVVVDSPPVLLMSDPVLLARACDAVLLVVKAGVTDAQSARKARLEFRNSYVAGVVLNQVAMGTTSPGERQS